MQHGPHGPGGARFVADEELPTQEPLLKLMSTWSDRPEAYRISVHRRLDTNAVRGCWRRFPKAPRWRHARPNAWAALSSERRQRAIQQSREGTLLVRSTWRFLGIPIRRWLPRRVALDVTERYLVVYQGSKACVHPAPRRRARPTCFG